MNLLDIYVVKTLFKLALGLLRGVLPFVSIWNEIYFQ